MRELTYSARGIIKEVEGLPIREALDQCKKYAFVLDMIDLQTAEEKRRLRAIDEATEYLEEEMANGRKTV